MDWNNFFRKLIIHIFSTAVILILIGVVIDVKQPMETGQIQGPCTFKQVFGDDTKWIWYQCNGKDVTTLAHSSDLNILIEKGKSEPINCTYKQGKWIKDTWYYCETQDNLK